MHEWREPVFDRWFAHAYPQTVRTLFRLLGNQALAEDLAAEALARALARWRRLEHAEYRDAWLTRVAVNLGLDELRRRPPLLMRAADPLSEIDRVELRVALRQALGRLPRRQREALALRYLVGLSPEEVAATLEVSLGTVKTHLQRGLRSLRSDPKLITEERLDVIAAD